MPIVKVKGGFKVRSYSTGKLLKRRYRTRRAAEKAATSGRGNGRKGSYTRKRRTTDLWGRWY